MRVFHRSLLLMLCIGVLWVKGAHFASADDEMLIEAYFTQPEQYSRIISLPGKGDMRYYAQNDPLWGALCYEKSDTAKRRPFRDSGCSPASAAMAIASLIPEDELWKIGDYCKRVYSLCPCSVNAARCIRSHHRYQLSSQWDYVRFLPLVFGDFATGNNIFSVYSRTSAAGTGTQYLVHIAKAFGLELKTSNRLQTAYDAMDEGAAVIALAAQGGAFTNTGHYVFLAHRDEEAVYILDPLYRTEYKTNGGGRLEILQPGLVKIQYKDISAALLQSFYIFQFPEE